ncbi:sensor histidine kinase [Domibacillus epiphyticus]|uniref:histidine kinase n=1 Tax=Domibacillus epiphyticus TaxID=1714355 RepID=A0A1V2A6A2_9BACI|nr:HAMP domain-containing sensor histidine kinase [Domibacillus epiphyticus]OMP66535.1 two-component sensor histidine kinase [Domibacillus epiphyticus]
MNPLRRRLIFHFSIQFILMAAAMILVLGALLFFLLQRIANEETKLNPPVGVLQMISLETAIEEGEAKLGQKWNDVLEKRGFWVQIIDESGDVMKSVNTPESLPNQYSVRELLHIEKERKYGKFTVLSEMETMYDDPYLYLLGYEDKEAAMLEALFRQYSKNGLMEMKSEVEEKLKSIDGSLLIIDRQGEIILSAGASVNRKRYKPLELAKKTIQPGTFSTATSIYQDPDSDYTWILETPKEKEKDQRMSLLEEVILGFGLIGVVVLVLTLAIAFWNGYRYGYPLFIFTGWLDRMEHGRYQDMMTDKERKKIFTKKGKVKMRYKLYKEVIDAFYSMVEKMNASVKERAQLEQTREEWMTGISHDLRTPLSTIQGYGHMLESGHYSWTSEELEEVGAVIREKGDYMLHLIEDFSLSFRLKNNELVLTKDVVNPDELLEGIVSKFEQDRTLNQYCFHFDQSNEQLLIEADIKWFERMIDNLVFNAVKHNPSGTKITVRVRRSISHVHVMIEDNGVGMNEETVNQLFDRYYRGTNTEERTEGAGLGMSTAKNIAELHDGTVCVQSALGEGTIVTVTLPICE